MPASNSVGLLGAMNSAKHTRLSTKKASATIMRQLLASSVRKYTRQACAVREVLWLSKVAERHYAVCRSRTVRERMEAYPHATAQAQKAGITIDRAHAEA